MKRFFAWSGLLLALFLHSGCLGGLPNASGPTLEGGTEAGNPPAGEFPAPPPDVDPRDEDPCQKTESAEGVDGENEQTPLCRKGQRLQGRDLGEEVFFAPPENEGLDEIEPGLIHPEGEEEGLRIKIRPEALLHFESLPEGD